MHLITDTIIGLSVPFIGTTLGAAVVYFMRKELNKSIDRALSGFAAGVMAAASVWSLIIPAIEQSATWDMWSFVPATVGFWIGILFLLLLDSVIPRLYRRAENKDPNKRCSRVSMLTLAVTLHNIPEGMAVGVVYAGLIAGVGNITPGGALMLATGIAIQNFPEGAIISMPLRSRGYGRTRSFIYGTLSGAVEPLFGLLAVACVGLITPAMPYLLSFAAGAMMYVVAQELIPKMTEDSRSAVGILSFSLGFTLMMSLDVALG